MEDKYKCPECGWAGDAPLFWSFKLICPTCHHDRGHDSEVVDRRDAEIVRLTDKVRWYERFMGEEAIE